jgi:hypothetical protein
MSAITNLFSKELKKTGFFEEWARYVITEASAESLAGFFLEGMRDENSEKRSAFTACAMFMKTRTWSDAYLDLRDSFSADEFEILSDPYAEKFYLRLKTVVLKSVEEYYEQFLDAKSKEVVEAFKDVPFEKFEEKLSLLIVREVAAQMEVLRNQIIQDIKKFMEEGGDSWKGGGEPIS